MRVFALPVLSDEIRGEFEVKDAKKVKLILSHKEALMDCIPGLVRVSDDEFKVSRKIAFITITLSGRIKRFEVTDDYVINEVEVGGSGVKLTVFSSFSFQDKKVSYLIKYTLESSNPLIESFASKESKELSETIISCAQKKLSS